jgi:hypothetical protein
LEALAPSCTLGRRDRLVTNVPRFPPPKRPGMLVAIAANDDRKGRLMDLQKAVAVARQQIEKAYAADVPRDIRLESFLYDDHLMVWSLTIGFALSDRAREALPGAAQARNYKIVRVSEADKSVLSVADR